MCTCLPHAWFDILQGRRRGTVCFSCPSAADLQIFVTQYHLFAGLYLEHAITLSDDQPEPTLGDGKARRSVRPLNRLFEFHDTSSSIISLLRHFAAHRPCLMPHEKCFSSHFATLAVVMITHCKVTPFQILPSVFLHNVFCCFVPVRLYLCRLSFFIGCRMLFPERLSPG